VLAASSTPASASNVSSLQSRASQLAAQIDAVNTKLQVLSEEYDQAKLREQSLGRQITHDRSALSEAESSVSQNTATLRKEAVDAYVSAGSGSGLSALMTSNASSLPLQQAYLQAASSSLKTATTSLQDAEHHLTIRETTLSKAEHSAAESESTLASSKQSAATLEAELVATENGVKGKLAAAVAQQEQIQQAEAAARDAAQRAAASTVTQAASQPAPPVSTASAVTTASGGSSQGAAAVAAAETQEGVPYVWGGATPGVGFDCSGLAMWAWGQAGVSLPHSAQAQYDSIEHVSLSDLEPGDLIFYASGGYIYHVIIYIGGGQAIQAEDTGTVIQITPVWGGAYGAGRP